MFFHLYQVKNKKQSFSSSLKTTRKRARNKQTIYMTKSKLTRLNFLCAQYFYILFQIFKSLNGENNSNEIPSSV